MQTYVGAAVGGAVGGALLSVGASPSIVNAATGFVTTGVTQLFEKASGENDRTYTEIIANSAIDGGVSYGLGKLPGINGITKGRNSYNAVYKSGLTKLRKGTAQAISAKVMKKGIVSTVINGLGLDVYYGLSQSPQYN